MSNVIELKKREDFGKTFSKNMRRESLIPGVIYGDNIESRHFVIAENILSSLKHSAKTAGLLDVRISGESDPVKAIVQKIQTDSVTGAFEHVDLYQVRMDKKLHVEVPFNFVGASRAVRDLGGILVKQFDHLAIECLPKDLIHSVDVPIDSLNTFEDVVRVKDLSLPDGVVTHLGVDQIVVSVTEPRSEKELEELKGEVKEDIEKVEVVGEKKEEDEGEAQEKAEMEK